MRRPTVAMLLLLAAACGGGSSSDNLPRDRSSRIEGLQFPDVPASSDRALDQPRPIDAPKVSDATREQSLDAPRDLPLSDLSPPDTKPGPDLPKPDAWKGGPCFYDWASWTCQTSSSGCSAGCGIATLTCISITWVTICTCTVNGVSKQCPQVGGSGCSRCSNAFQSGCCVPP